MKLREVSDRLPARYRQLRYLLDNEPYAITGPEPRPGHGKHRDFNQAQAFWLACAYLLYQSGLPHTRACELTNQLFELMAYLSRHTRSRTFRLIESMWALDPLRDRWWQIPSFAEITFPEGQAIARLGVTVEGKASTSDWYALGVCKPASAPDVVTVYTRLNLTEILRRLSSE